MWQKVYRRLARRQYDEEASVGIGAVSPASNFRKTRGEQRQLLDRLRPYGRAANERLVERAEGQA
jgi:hypothetical protein